MYTCTVHVAVLTIIYKLIAVLYAMYIVNVLCALYVHVHVVIIVTCSLYNWNYIKIDIMPNTDNALINQSLL